MPGNLCAIASLVARSCVGVALGVQIADRHRLDPFLLSTAAMARRATPGRAASRPCRRRAAARAPRAAIGAARAARAAAGADCSGRPSAPRASRSRRDGLRSSAIRPGRPCVRAARWSRPSCRGRCARSPANSAASSTPSVSASSFSPSSDADRRVSGVEGTLARVAPPKSSTATRSVKVPPTSMPMRYTGCPSPQPSPRIAGRGRDPWSGRVRGNSVRVTNPFSMSRAMASGSRSAGSPQPPPPPDSSTSTSSGRITRPISLVLIARGGRPSEYERIAMRHAVGAAEDAAGPVAHAVAGGVADRRLGGLDDHLDDPAGSAAIFASPPESGRNSWRRKNSGKRTSVTSRLPNLIPPAACHSPAPGQPSPAGEAPPPGRAWKKCQMKGLPDRGSLP